MAAAPISCTVPTPTSDGMAAVFQREGLSKGLLGWICTIVPAVGRIYYSRNRDGIIYSSRTRPEIIYSLSSREAACSALLVRGATWWQPPAIDRSRWRA